MIILLYRLLMYAHLMAWIISIITLKALIACFLADFGIRKASNNQVL